MAIFIHNHPSLATINCLEKMLAQAKNAEITGIAAITIGRSLSHKWHKHGSAKHHPEFVTGAFLHSLFDD